MLVIPLRHLYRSIPAKPNNLAPKHASMAMLEIASKTGSFLCSEDSIPVSPMHPPTFYNGLPRFSTCPATTACFFRFSAVFLRLFVLENLSLPLITSASRTVEGFVIRVCGFSGEPDWPQSQTNTRHFLFCLTQCLSNPWMVERCALPKVESKRAGRPRGPCYHNVMEDTKTSHHHQKPGLIFLASNGDQESSREER